MTRRNTRYPRPAFFDRDQASDRLTGFGDNNLLQGLRDAAPRAREQSLSVSLTTSLVVTVVVIASLVIGAVSSINNRAGKKHVQEKANEYLTLLVQALETAIWDMDDHAIRNIGLSYAQNDVIAALTITDDAGEVLYHTAKQYADDTITRSRDITHQEEVIGTVTIVVTSPWYTVANRHVLWISIMTTGVVYSPWC